jgi:cell division protein FtsB
MLAISIPAIKGIAGVMGAAYQKAIQEVLADREAELKELGDHWMLGSRHNATVRGKDDILKSIARENLGLENWQDVRFA